MLYKVPSLPVVRLTHSDLAATSSKMRTAGEGKSLPFQVPSFLIFTQKLLFQHIQYRGEKKKKRIVHKGGQIHLTYKLSYIHYVCNSVL